jgi:hypothetical protein
LDESDGFSGINNAATINAATTTRHSREGGNPGTKNIHKALTMPPINSSFIIQRSSLPFSPVFQYRANNHHHTTTSTSTKKKIKLFFTDPLDNNPAEEYIVPLPLLRRGIFSVIPTFASKINRQVETATTAMALRLGGLCLGSSGDQGSDPTNMFKLISKRNSGKRSNGFRAAFSLASLDLLGVLPA